MKKLILCFVFLTRISSIVNVQFNKRLGNAVKNSAVHKAEQKTDQAVIDQATAPNSYK
ncbi:MAG: hypothetical protein LBV69_08845 [Bacteroidales bacterium]|jgi:hypothetical protein|nr:hypothetical protein [Bacteroidales bacterium]